MHPIPSGHRYCDNGFKRMDRLSVCVINTVTDAKIQSNEKEDTVNMCKAIRDIRNYSKKKDWQKVKPKECV